MSTELVTRIKALWARRWVRRAATFIVFLVVYFGVRTWQQRTLVEGPAPALHAVTISGPDFDLALQRGRPVLVYFWGTWCPVCRLEQGAIESVAEDHTVVGVALQSGTAAEVTKYMREHNLKVAVVNDPDGALAGEWGVRVTPTSYIIDSGGHIRFHETGYTSEIGLRVRLWLAGLWAAS